MLTEILFKIYKLFSFTGIINKDFNDSLEKTENFSLPFRLLPKSPRSSELSMGGFDKCLMPKFYDKRYFLIKE